MFHFRVHAEPLDWWGSTTSIVPSVQSCPVGNQVLHNGQVTTGTGMVQGTHIVGVGLCDEAISKGFHKTLNGFEIATVTRHQKGRMVHTDFS